MEEFFTVAKLLRHMKENYKNEKLFNYKHQDNWQSISLDEFIEYVRFMTLGLESMGVVSGDKVVIFSDSSPWWVITDFAILNLGAISVPVFAKISKDNFLFEVDQTEPKWIFVAGEEPWKIIGEHPNLKDKELALDPHEQNHAFISFNDIIQKGKDLDSEDPKRYDEIIKNCKAENVATIIYTSGSTGVPKGAVISHRSVVGVAHLDVFKLVHGKDRYLNILPLAHIFARNVIYNIMAWGIDVYFVDDVKNVGFICKEVRPTVAIVVPRLMEKIYSKMLTKIQQSSPVKKLIGRLAVYFASQSDNILKRMLTPVFDKIVYSKFREALGGNVRGLLSGGAPLNVQLLEFFNTVGIPLFSGYGSTEGGCTASNDLYKNKYGTVGKTIGVVEHIIDDKGELLLKGATLMSEYYKASEKTRATIDENGWLHSGDKATIDEDGYITIIGRIKELYKTSTGEYIAPVPIEQEITQSSIVDMAVVVAEHRKYATCLLFPDFDVIESLKKKRGRKHLSNEEFLQSQYIHRKMAELLVRVNSKLNKWEHIADYRFIPQVLTIEGGELTPTMKVKRDVIVEKYSEIIDTMYS